MLLNEDLKQYKYVVQAHDNYITLYNKSYVSASYQDPKTIKVLNQYIFPSDMYFYTYETFYTDRDFMQIENVNTSYFNTIEFFMAVVLVYIVIKGLIFGMNAITNIVKRGGVFHD